MIEQPRSEVALPQGSACPVYWNANGTGCYRTAWTGAQLQAFARQGLGQLNGAERLTLVYDLRALLKTGKLDSAATDALLNTLTNDSQPEIVRAARIALGLETEPP